MQTYISQVVVNIEEYQNPQELVSIWGDIQDDVHRVDGEITNTYAILGDYDFHITFRVPDEGAAFQVTQIIERHGLETKTLQALPLDQIGELIDDI